MIGESALRKLGLWFLRGSYLIVAASWCVSFWVVPADFASASIYVGANASCITAEHLIDTCMSWY